MLSTDRAKLALPVMSKKRTRMDTPFKTNIMEVAMDDKDYDDQTSVKLLRPLISFYLWRKRIPRIVVHDRAPLAS